MQEWLCFTLLNYHFRYQQMKYFGQLMLVVCLNLGPHSFSLPWQFQLSSSGKALPGTDTRVHNVDSSGCGEV